MFRGKVNDNWVRMKLLDLVKAPGLGRHKPVLGRAVIGGPGVNMNSEMYQDFDLEVLSMDKKEPLANQLDTFIKGLNKPL